MPTPIQMLERRIDRLRETHPNSRLLKDYEQQLREWKAAPEGSASETYFSGRPLDGGGSADPMQPAADQLEKALRAKVSQDTESPSTDTL